MKIRIQIISLLIMMIASSWMTPKQASAQHIYVGFQLFYDELSPYGTWVRNPDFGYVWIPDVEPGFNPYSTNGYWVFTDEGWTWVSDYSWGWAPFHYGRWFVDPQWGPMWVPDYEWGPGWVTWRRSGDFYGWAPIGPGVSITIAYGSSYYQPYNQWTFVRDRDFGRRNINQYYVNNTYNRTIINNSTVINNTRIDRSRNVTYNSGPNRSEVEKHAGRKFTPVQIRESSKPGQKMTNNQLQIYKPEVRKDVSKERKSSPARVSDYKDVKTPARRGANTRQQKPYQPSKAQPSQQQQEQRKEQPSKQQPAQQQQKQQQPKQQPVQQQQKQQQPRQQPAQQQQKQKQQPPKQQPAQQQHKEQPVKQQPSQPQHNNPSKNTEGEKKSKDTKPPKSM